MYPVVELTVEGHRHNVGLHLWGRQPQTGWWGLVSWRHPIREPGSYSQLINVCAWASARLLRQPRSGADTGLVPRIRLEDDVTFWPLTGLPARWDGHYLGTYAGGPLPLPDGTETVQPEPPQPDLREP